MLIYSDGGITTEKWLDWYQLTPNSSNSPVVTKPRPPNDVDLEYVELGKKATSKGAQLEGLFSKYKNISKSPETLLSKLKKNNWSDDVLKKLDGDLADGVLADALGKKLNLVDGWEELKNTSFCA